MRQCFDFYDLTIEASSTTADLVEEVRRHFAYFSIPPRDGQVRIEMRRVPPPCAELSPLPASVITEAGNGESSAYGGGTRRISIRTCPSRGGILKYAKCRRTSSTKSAVVLLA